MKTEIIYKSTQQYSLKANFYDCGRKNAPVIMYIHGGGLIWGSRNDLKEEVRELYLQNGFSIFSIDYRLAPVTRLSAILEDVRDAFAWLQTEGLKSFSIDPGRIAIIGASAGGFLALNAGLFENKPQAIISFYGYGDISASWATTPSSFYLKKPRISKEIKESLVSNKIITEATVHERFLIFLYGRQTGKWVQDVTGLHPIFDKNELLKYCPLHHMDENFPPTFLLHGTSDTDVPYEQSVIAKARLDELGVDAKLFTIPGGDHVFENEFHQPVVQEAFREVITFLKKELE